MPYGARLYVSKTRKHLNNMYSIATQQELRFGCGKRLSFQVWAGEPCTPSNAAKCSSRPSRYGHTDFRLSRGLERAVLAEMKKSRYVTLENSPRAIHECCLRSDNGSIEQGTALFGSASFNFSGQLLCHFSFRREQSCAPLTRWLAFPTRLG